MSGKIPDDRGFYFLPTVPDFADMSDNRHKSVPETPCSILYLPLPPTDDGFLNMGVRIFSF